MSGRRDKCERLRQAYRSASAALLEVHRVLNLDDIRGYGWSVIHCTAIKGLRAVLTILSSEVPDYRDGDKNH